MVTYAAMLDVPRCTVEFVARRLATRRRRLRTSRGSRALSPSRQAVLVLRWFRERGCVHCLARDAGVSQATGYRYLHECIGVLGAQAPDLYDVLKRCQGTGMSQLVLDGTLVECDRVAGVRGSGRPLHRCRGFARRARHRAGLVTGGHLWPGWARTRSVGASGRHR
ncbi:hypothetical protein GCM10009753_45790 [Streptantibioticus ferralitis]